MIDVGYSPNTAKAPTKLTESQGWQTLLETYLPDEDLAKVHKEGLFASKKTLLGEEPDYSVRHKYLETAYKIKKKEGAEEQPQQVQVIDKQIQIILDDTKGRIKQYLSKQIREGVLNEEPETD